MSRTNILKKMSFGMWISFTCLAVFIAVLFWFLLGQSVRNNYRSESTDQLEHTAWTIAEKYGQSDFENNLRLIAVSEKCFIQIVSEDESTMLLSIDSEGKDSISQPEGIFPDNLFGILDNTKGRDTYYVEDSTRNIEYAVHAIVLANWDGNREVLILGKSLANVDYMMQIINSRLLFALAAVLLIASVLSFFITARFAAPINRLTEQARKMAKGNYQIMLPEGGFYEVEELSNTLKIAAEEFEATEGLRREFVANISHDMKTPLTVIKMNAEMIQTISGEDKDKRNAHLNRILDETEKLTGFINDTMYLSKLQSGTMPYNPRKMNISTLIKSVVSTFEIHREQEDFALDIQIEPDLMVLGDRKLLGRVLSNFITNALKYSGKDKDIRIKSFRKSGRIITQVIDNGMGIDESLLKNIWVRYYQVEPYSVNKSGIGIGLHIAKEILELHHAQYGVESKVEEGSMFWFALEEDK